MKYNKLTDEQLVNLIIEDNKYAFEEVYHRYWYKLFGVAYHEIGTREEAEELVHDLFESLWNRRHQLNIRMLSAYLVVSIKHLSTNYIKSQITNRKFQEYLIFNEIRQSHATEEVVHFSELSDAVEEAMKKLQKKLVKCLE
jgi:RNA polymerase sigma-70 factor (ECF subfamily)